ncbi:hypothetical protein B0H13DRAFT_2300266 [Mycena leptocephala]|nr:hypothetical protein B0H13DRAFT_2300266 [Mycena leptocephala]
MTPDQGWDIEDPLQVRTAVGWRLATEECALKASKASIPSLPSLCSVSTVATHTDPATLHFPKSDPTLAHSSPPPSLPIPKLPLNCRLPYPLKISTSTQSFGTRHPTENFDFWDVKFRVFFAFSRRFLEPGHAWEVRQTAA